MKIWHKILIAPVLAIVFLVGFGAVAYGVVAQQNQALQDLSEKRMAGVIVASDAAQEFSEIHSNVYRLFTWLANMSEDKVKAAIGEQKGKVDKIVASLTAFRNQQHVTAEGRKLVDSMLPMLTKYRKLADDAIDLGTIDVAMGAMAMQAADIQFQSNQAMLGIDVSRPSV